MLSILVPILIPSFRGISNLCFVEHYEVVVQNSDRPDAGFASECVAHLPEHLNQMRTRGLLK